MLLAHIPSGSHIFIDANIFIYHFLGLDDACSGLLLRIENKELSASTSSVVLAETWHRLLIAEAIEVYRIAPRRAVTYLKSHPDKVKPLSRCRQAVLSIPKMRVAAWSLLPKDLLAAQSIQEEHGLLANDSINLAIMQSHDIKDIATNDRDFNRIHGIKVWQP